jgi:hypothetical protein
MISPQYMMLAADSTPAEATLEPLHAPEEIRGLIIAINRMMERVSAVMQSQSHFIANVAHQLRTPLSGLCRDRHGVAVHTILSSRLGQSSWQRTRSRDRA